MEKNVNTCQAAYETSNVALFYLNTLSTIFTISIFFWHFLLQWFNFFPIVWLHCLPFSFDFFFFFLLLHGYRFRWQHFFFPFLSFSFLNKNCFMCKKIIIKFLLSGCWKALITKIPFFSLFFFWVKDPFFLSEKLMRIIFLLLLIGAWQ